MSKSTTPNNKSLLSSSCGKAIVKFLDGCPNVKRWSFVDNQRHHAFLVSWIDGMITLVCDSQRDADALKEFCTSNRYECLVIDEQEITKIASGYQNRIIWDGFRYSVPRQYLGDSVLNKEAMFHEIVSKICPWPGLICSEKVLGDDLRRLRKEQLAGYRAGEELRSTAPNSGGMPGRKIMTHFQPHFWDVSPKKRLPLPRAFDDKRIILHCLKISCSEKESLSFERLLREINFHYSKFGRASHFAPGFARVIIQLMGASGKQIFDPCCGWGGRLIGSYLENCVYSGCDLSSHTVKGLGDIAQFLGFSCNVVQSDCLQWEWPKCDLVFTSPPFYDIEEYVGGEQPWMVLRSRGEWIEKFVAPFAEKVGKTLAVLYLDEKTKNDFETIRKFDRVIGVSNRRHARRKMDVEYLCVYE